jgi:uncharacterized protein with GYD domain
MATYVSLIHWTEQGIQNFQETTQRAQELTSLVEGNGGTIRELLWTIGQYDLVCIADFPDEATGVAVLLQVGSQGNIRSSTMSAFSAAEMTDIIRRAG